MQKGLFVAENGTDLDTRTEESPAGFKSKSLPVIMLYYCFYICFRVSVEKARGTPRGTDRDRYIERGWQIDPPRRRGGGGYGGYGGGRDK